MAGPANRNKVEMEVDAPPPASETQSINDQIRKDAAAKIKSRFMTVDAITGRAQLFDTATHAPGVDYTAGGLLKPRWIANTEANIMSKRMKGYKLPSEISSQLKDLTMGTMVLMVRSYATAKEHEDGIEKLNKNWEAKARSKTSPKAGQGFGEFEVTPQSATRG